MFRSDDKLHEPCSARSFDIAKRLAHKSDHHTHKLGAVVVRGNKIIGVGFNKMKTSPKSNHPFKSIHAELDAILSSHPDRLNGSDIYIYRQTSSGELAMAKPCLYCQDLIRAAGIRRAYYTRKGGYDVIHF